MADEADLVLSHRQTSFLLESGGQDIYSSCIKHSDGEFSHLKTADIISFQPRIMAF